jgi:hypothetical protein
MDSSVLALNTATDCLLPLGSSLASIHRARRHSWERSVIFLGLHPISLRAPRMTAYRRAFLVSPGNKTVINQICRRVMPQGFLLLDSGGSYHACSLTLVSDVDRIHMLAKALLASPIVDARYVAHQLLDSNSIRVSQGGKTGRVPIVIDAWTP